MTGSTTDPTTDPNRAGLPDNSARWDDACLAAALFAVDPVGSGGISVRALPGPVRDLWMELLRELLPPDLPFRRIPLHIADGRLLGGLDLAATLHAGRPVAERGLLAEADGGVVQLAMAERIGRSTAAYLSAALDNGEIQVERDGITARTSARVGVVALDEGANEEEQVPHTLLDRFAFLLDLGDIRYREALASDFAPSQIQTARCRLGEIEIDEEAIEMLCGTALALGVDSLRSSIAALRVARASAALAGRDRVESADVSAAARLVLAPRATRIPMPEQPDEEQQAEEPPPPPEDNQDEQKDQDQTPQQEIDKPLEEQVLEAAQAAIPPNLLAMLQMGAMRQRSKSSGKSGAIQSGSLRGRPAGTRRGEPGAGARLNVIDTLRVAAPWQRLRRQERAEKGSESEVLVEVRRDDFRITRYRQRSETTTIFVVDASGSAALHRLAEAKGAVELLLADCYVRRDRVAMIAFRGPRAEILLPPTRSLVRAKRGLASLPGGGGTPLASGIDAALALADGVTRRGGTAVVILLTDGRGNVNRDGIGGRAQAAEDALASARAFRVAELKALVVDMSPRPRPDAENLAREMGAVYLPLPHADARALSGAVQAVS
ncbi:magnesium chelatase subunit D [Lamprobacter modestohalophilus]|uniref:magnesium chelatase subunit D n=1 Tax=Lamprobacter modestohalophilus TaxID=1064514 RepID=UPI002ADEE044|nr:magnesium chelatase subunit D [Lamprobacter modestohalophilus]MEA1051476.1 magnesium chelatase subunit D [Lamprobacter modestohalophilus]